jgi:phage tail sheath protein FI
MINLLSNTDDYKFNLLVAPGLYNSIQTSQVTSIISNTQNRGDSIFVLDLVPYNSNLSAVTTQATSRDTSYAASYWPWLQVIDPDLGKNVWVPASTLIPAVYAFNDNASEPWFAPAGINRGGLGQVTRVEQKLPQTSRDTLYNNKVNPIATFPGTGVVVYGQKTLQTKASALDRVNVRRLLITLKSYISQVAQNLVFEQNTIATRNAFLAQVNPYLESVQQRQGLYAFKVIMDDTNNTADVIDRNQLIGQIYLQPTKTAEFIYLDFNILPTGATFPA